MSVGSWRRAVVVLAVSTLALAVLGVAYRLIEAWPLALFNLDGEYRLPAAWTALILLAAASTLAALRLRGEVGRSAWAMVALLALMACDESFGVHERLEARLGVDWQRLYAPLIALAAAGAAVLLASIRDRGRAVLLFALGCGAWGASQVLEEVQWDGDVVRPGYGTMMVIEELLEIGGSGLFLLAFLWLWETGERGRVPGLRAAIPQDRHAVSESAGGPGSA